MGEKLSDSGLMSPESKPENEQLGDWLVRYEVSQGEKTPELPKIQEKQTPTIETLPETYFERRHEVKDAPNEPLAQSRLQPMVPLAQVLQTNPVVPKNPPPPDSYTPQARSYESSISRLLPKATYKHAIRLGFYTGLLIITGLALYNISR